MKYTHRAMHIPELVGNIQNIGSSHYNLNKLNFPCELIIAEIPPEMTDEAIKIYFENRHYSVMECHSAEAVEQAEKVFLFTARQNEDQFIFVQNIKAEQPVHAVHFIRNLIQPSADFYNETLTETLDQFTDFALNIPFEDIFMWNELTLFIQNFSVQVQKHFQNRFAVNGVEAFNGDLWKAGNGFALPPFFGAVKTVKDRFNEAKVSLFEAVMITNIAVLNEMLLPSNADSLDYGVNNIKALIHYYHEVLKLNANAEHAFKTGSYADLKLVKDGFIFTIDFAFEDQSNYMNDVVQEKEQIYYVAELDNNNQVVMNTLQKFADGYNDGCYQDTCEQFEVLKQYANTNLCLLGKIED